MKHAHILKLALALIVLLAIPAVLFAQPAAADPTTPPLDLNTIFASAAAMAAFVVTVSQLVKAYIFKVEGGAAVALVFGLSVVIPFAGYFLNIYKPTGGITEVVTFCITTFMLAAGGFKVVMGVADRVSLPPSK